MDIHGSLWISMKSMIDGCQLMDIGVSMDIHGYLRIIHEIHGYPCISKDIHEYPSISIDIHGYPWKPNWQFFKFGMPFPILASQIFLSKACNKKNANNKRNHD